MQLGRAGVLIVAMIASGPALAGGNARFEAALRSLDPADRLQQVCNSEAMKSIARGGGHFRPDRADVAALSTPKARGNTLQGTGGAFRSGKRWYQFSFTCTATPDHMKVLSFTQQVGSAIPPEKWSAYGLFQ